MITVKAPAGCDSENSFQLGYARQLMLGASVAVTCYHYDEVRRHALETLERLGYARHTSNGAPGKYEVLVFKATDELLAWAAANEAARLTFDQAAQAWGKTFKPYRKPRLSRAEWRAYPDARERAEGLPRNEDGEFSSPDLTAWYVAEFCRRNNLKEV